ncbi:MAG: PrsW family intramembrane metalloprotease [Candidatus Sabulitectum sp.]|nr:PrsW family intramembrane metalloprotease [Candidatus Sabulitectum sp.]
MLHVVTFILTFLPTVLLFTYFYRRDRNREPRKELTVTFLLGALAFLPVVIAEMFLSSLNVPGKSNLVLFNLYEMFVNVALPEEFFKLMVIVLYSARTAAFDEPMDGVVYGVGAALGFATIENIFYVVDGGFGTAVIRALFSVPSHALWGAILGYAVGQVRFNKRKNSFIFSGLLIAVLLHGLFNSLLLAVSGTAAYTETRFILLQFSLFHIFLIVFTLEIIWILKTVKRLRCEQEQVAEKKAE